MKGLGKKEKLPEYPEFRRTIRPLLEKIPADEYPRILQEAEDLVKSILDDPSLFEPIHCVHRHGVTVVRRAGTPEQVAKSRSIVRALASQVGSATVDKLGKIALMGMASYLVWQYAELYFWFC